MTSDVPASCLTLLPSVTASAATRPVPLFVSAVSPPPLLAVAPFLCHPNLWIRYGAVGFITMVAQHLNVADVYCKLMPHLNPFVTQPIIQVSPPLIILTLPPPPSLTRPSLLRSIRSWSC